MSAQVAPQLAGREPPRTNVPPWFPQMSIRPDGEPAAPTDSGRSWLWLVLVVLMAGAAAWWLRSTG